MKEQNCCCSGGLRLVFACSGAADVGAIADQTARKLSNEGIAKMFCLAGIGGRVPGIMETTNAAEKILAIDGCPLNCAKRCLEEAGFANFAHLQLADLGMQKGKSQLSEEKIDIATKQCLQLLGD